MRLIGKRLVLSKRSKQVALEGRDAKGAQKGQSDDCISGLVELRQSQASASVPVQMAQTGQRVIGQRQGQQGLESQHDVWVHVLLQIGVNFIEASRKV